MKSWKLELNALGKTLGEDYIKGGIFQGDSLSPLLFVLCMVPLIWLLRTELRLAMNGTTSDSNCITYCLWMT